jgi:hypothetical protein
MANKSKDDPCGIRIERRTAAQKGQAELILFIRGHKVGASQKQTRLLACLHENHGRIVSYERLIQVLGHKTVGRPQVHILQQYVFCISKILAAHKASPQCPALAMHFAEYLHHQANAKVSFPAEKAARCDEGFHLKSDVPI